MKSSFVLYTDYAEHIEMLSNEEAGILLKDIFKYAKDYKEPDYTNEQGMLKMAFSFIRAQLDRDSGRYEETVRKRSEAGKKGGLAKQANARNAKQNKQDVANQADNVTVTDNVTVNDIKKEKEKKKRTQVKKECFGEFGNVKLTDEEYKRLGVDFGEVKRALFIKRLDEYMKEKPTYKSQDHNLAIRRWVVRAVEEDAQRDAGMRKKPNTVFHSFDMKHDYDFDDMEHKLLRGD